MENNLPFEIPSFNLEELKPDNTDLGTFKSVKTLKDAYDSLRSCYTKNAMELAKIKKNTSNSSTNDVNQAEVFVKTNENTENEAQNAQNVPENSDLNDFRQEIKDNNEQILDEKTPKNQENESDKAALTPDENVSDKVEAPEITPKKQNIWENVDWNNQVVEFFEQYPDAKNHSKELAQILVNDKAIRENPAPLTNAWIKFLAQREQKFELTDEFIEKNILKNQKICDLVISNYLNKIKSNKSAPSVMTNAEGASLNVEKHKTASNMAEAKEMAKKFFK